MIYDAILEIVYNDHNQEGLTLITSEFSDVKISLWCNWSIDIIVLESENSVQKNNIFNSLDRLFGNNMILDSQKEIGPLIMRICNCPSTSVTTILAEYDCFHVPPIEYEKNKELLHIMMPSNGSSDLFDKIKDNEAVRDVNLKYLSPHKFPDKPFPIYLPINDLLMNLTDKQYKILNEAYNSGYYELPRQVKTEELAKMFDISRRALEDHLRKAERNIFNKIVPYFLMSRLEKL